MLGGSLLANDWAIPLHSTPQISVQRICGKDMRCAKDQGSARACTHASAARNSEVDGSKQTL